MNEKIKLVPVVVHASLEALKFVPSADGKNEPVVCPSEEAAFVRFAGQALKWSEKKGVCTGEVLTRHIHMPLLRAERANALCEAMEITATDLIEVRAMVNIVEKSAAKATYKVAYTEDESAVQVIGKVEKVKAPKGFFTTEGKNAKSPVLHFGGAQTVVTTSTKRKVRKV